jgi:uncharacterized membrane protein HdeD (DUF308 family)
MISIILMRILIFILVFSMTILVLVFGLIALSKGEFKITNRRKVKGSMAQTLGILLLVDAAVIFIPGYGHTIQFFLLILIIALGLPKSEKIEQVPTISKTST